MIGMVKAIELALEATSLPNQKYVIAQLDNWNNPTAWNVLLATHDGTHKNECFTVSIVTGEIGIRTCGDDDDETSEDETDFRYEY